MRITHRNRHARSVRSARKVLLATAWLAALAAPIASAQGGHGQHGGAPDEVPGLLPGYAGPGDALSRRGAVPAAPSTGVLPRTGPGTPGAAPPLVARPAVDVHTLIEMFERDENDWRIWWRLNRDPLLVVDPSSVLPMSTDGGFYLGGGDQTRDRTRVVKGSVVVEQVLPALEAALADETSPSVRSAILIALGRAGTLASDESARRVLRLAADSDRGVAEAAVIAAGLQSSPYVIRRLVHVVHGCEAGVELLGGRAVDTRMASFAALAIGLGVHKSGHEDLRRFVIFDLARTASNPFAAADVPVACVATVGLLPLPWSGDVGPDQTRPAPHVSREGQLAWLLQAVRAEGAHRQVRGHAALALGRLTQDAPEIWREHVARTLLELLDERSDAGVETRQGAAIALGAIGDCDDDSLDRAVRRGLVRASRDGDPLTRRFALVAISRVAGRDGDGSGLPDEGRAELVAHLRTNVKHGKAGLDAWAALGLGTLQRELFRAGMPPSLEVQELLARELATCRTPTTVGAFGLGLALSMAPSASDDLAEALEHYSGDEPAAAALSIALGLTGGAEARTLLVELIEGTSGRPALLHDAALALALSGDFSGTPRLVEALGRAGALDSRAALASALGRTGDTRAIAPLVAGLTDLDAPQASRALSARGLGWLVDQGRAPVWTPLTCDLNWGADTSTLAGVAGGDFLALLRDF